MKPGGIAAACSPGGSWPGRSIKSPNSSDQDVGNSPYRPLAVLSDDRFGSFATVPSRQQTRSCPLCPESGSEFSALDSRRRTRNLEVPRCAHEQSSKDGGTSPKEISSTSTPIRVLLGVYLE